MELKSLGMKIKSARRERGLTLEVLSEEIGISRNFLWEIEAGRKAPALPTLYNLGVTLDVSIDYLLGVTPEKRSISHQLHRTERELKIDRIVHEISSYGLDDLLFLSSLVSAFSQYVAQK